MAEKGRKKESGPSKPPPASAAPPKHFVVGQGLGIRQLNAIRRNVATPNTCAIGRYANHEPIPLPPGLDHFYHLPAPKRINGGKGGSEQASLMSNAAVGTVLLRERIIPLNCGRRNSLTRNGMLNRKWMLRWMSQGKTKDSRSLFF